MSHMSRNFDGKFSTHEQWLALDDGFQVYTKTWKPAATAVRARVVLVHGFSDHCNNFSTLFPALAAAGIEVFGWDQRGWGRSVKKPADKGLSGPTEQVMADMSSVLRTLLQQQQHSSSPSSSTGSAAAAAAAAAAPPLFLYGHSMGGAQTLTYAATGPPDLLRRVRGFLAEAPLVGLSPATRPWPITVAAGRLAASLLPRMQMVNELDARLLSRDPQVCDDYKADPLVHNTGTLEGLAGMLDRGINLDTGKVRIGGGGGGNAVRSVWVAHGTADGITHEPSTRRYFEQCIDVEDKEYRGYEGWYHVKPGDDKFEYARAVTDWILARSE